jgi:hypothetical protein
MSRFDELETRADDLIQRLAAEFKDLEGDLRWSVTRALIHRAIHFGTDQPGLEFCTLATYLGEMVGHAHKLAHGDNPKANSHKDLTH